jgi:hypothetical protein
LGVLLQFARETSWLLQNSWGNYFWAVAGIGINRFCSTFHIHAHAPHHDQPLLILALPQAIGRYR